MRDEVRLLQLAADLFGDRPTGFAIVVPCLHKLPDGETPLLTPTDDDIVQAAGSGTGVTSLREFCARMYVPREARMFPLSTDKRDGEVVPAPNMEIYVQGALVDTQQHPWLRALAKECEPSTRASLLLTVGANRQKRMALRFVAAHTKDRERHAQPWGKSPAIFLASYDRHLDILPKTYDLAEPLSELQKSISGRQALGWKQLKHLCGDVKRDANANINDGMDHKGPLILRKADWSCLTVSQRRWVFGVGIVALVRVDHLPLDPVRACMRACLRSFVVFLTTRQRACHAHRPSGSTNAHMRSRTK